MNLHRITALLGAMACLLSQGCSTQRPPAPAPAPEITLDFGKLSVTPATGTGMQGVFKVVLDKKSGGPTPVQIGLLINEVQNGERSCYIYQNVVANETALVNDSGAGSVRLEGKSIGNNQCEVLQDGTSSSSDQSRVSVNLHIRFRPEFKGAKQLYVIALDDQNRGTGLEQLGSWTVQ